ncbi:hypothetical protein BH20ACI3_BH20ACI3_01050 [soil metagenome]
MGKQETGRGGIRNGTGFCVKKYYSEGEPETNLNND